MRRFSLLVPAAALVALAGCATPPAPPPKAAPPPPPPVAIPQAGLDRVMGQDAGALEALFGTPDQDLREPTVRRLQFASAVCVLDVYLYPGAEGRFVARYIDARLTSGEDFDRASCIAALARRPAAR